jgi:hypothetical protein
MNDKIKLLVKESIISLINNTIREDKYQNISERHEKKIHFIPIPYRILNGLLQSLNIQFGNYIETLIHLIVTNEEHLKIVTSISGQKKIQLPLSNEAESLIDQYISDCQSSTEDNLEERFESLIFKIVQIEKKSPKVLRTHDIDVLFQNQNDGWYYYLEVKYNDDHDTGKYIDINRKFIKTFIGLVNYLKIDNLAHIKPIIYYLNNKIMKGNIYVPERKNIYRGPKLFEEFFTLNYFDLDRYLKNIGDDSDVLSIFDQLYKKIRYSS